LVILYSKISSSQSVRNKTLNKVLKSSSYVIQVDHRFVK
jgi:hypothetical protein